MTNIRSQEYDAFGPWIFVIDDVHTLPPLFERYQKYADRALMMFKIPRHIERRNANPNMHLYDAVIGIFDSYLLVLDRVDSSVKERYIEYRDIQAIKKTSCLLHGDLSLYTNSETVTITYNTVSDDIIARAVGLIRSMQPYKTVDLGLPAMTYSISTIEFLYAHLIDNLKKDDENTVLIAYQPSKQLTGKQSLFGKILSMLTNIHLLQCTAFLTNGRELIVLERSVSVKALKTTDYSYSYLYIQLSRIKCVLTEPHPKIHTLKRFVFGTVNHTFSSSFDDNNTGIDAFHQCLSAWIYQPIKGP